MAAAAAMGGLLDLEKHFVFYGTYHSNPVNIFIHVLFVWPIFFSFQLLFYFTPPLFHVSSTLGLPLVFNFGFAVVLTYSIFYILLERRTGSLAALLCILCWVGSSVLGSRLGFSRTWKVGAAVQAFCWTTQFIGHGLFERRAPALLDNLFQAALAAPFFVVLEVQHMLFSYEPYPGFYARVQATIDEERKKWRARKNKNS